MSSYWKILSLLFHLNNFTPYLVNILKKCCHVRCQVIDIMIHFGINWCINLKSSWRHLWIIIFFLFDFFALIIISLSYIAHVSISFLFSKKTMNNDKKIKKLSEGNVLLGNRFITCQIRPVQEMYFFLHLLLFLSSLSKLFSSSSNILSIMSSSPLSFRINWLCIPFNDQMRKQF